MLGPSGPKHWRLTVALAAVVVSIGALGSSSVAGRPPVIGRPVIVASNTAGELAIVEPVGSTTGVPVNVGGPAALFVTSQDRSPVLVYVAPEWGSRDGKVMAFEVVGTTLRLRRTLDLGGTGSVHIALAPSRNQLLVSHYRTGSVSVVSLDRSGLPKSSTTISLPRPNSKTHAALFVGSTVALVTDVAHDEIQVLELKGAPRFADPIMVRAGDKPRSMAMLETGGVLVTNQRSNSVSCLRLQNDSWREMGRTVLDDQTANVGAKAGIPADIVPVAKDAVAVVNRGPDEVIIISVSSGCDLRVASRTPSGAKRPRALAPVGATLFVSHELGPLVALEDGRVTARLWNDRKVWSVARSDSGLRS